MKTNIAQVHLSWTLAELTAKRVLRRNSTIAFLVIGLGPCLMFLFWILTRVWPSTLPPTKPYGIFEYIHSIYFLSFYVPLLALFLGLGTVSDEIETRNITFTLTRPLSRISIVFGRYVGHLLAALALVNISLFMAYMSNMLFQVEDLFAKLPALLNGAFVLSFGTACYLAMVAMFGTILRRFAVVISLLWILFDTLASLFFPFGLLKHLNVRYRMLASYAEMLPQALPSTVSVEPSAAVLNALVCMVFAVIACGVMAARLSFEIVLTEGAK